MSSGRDSGVAATESQENLLAHPMVRIHEQTRTASYVLRRIGSTSVCSDGAEAPGVGQVHGLARCLGVEILAVLHRRRSQMTRTQGITTTFSAFCVQTTGMSLPIVWDHEASMAPMQTCRSSGRLGHKLKGNRPADLRSQNRQQRVAYIDGSGGQVYLIESRWNGSVH